MGPAKNEPLRPMSVFAQPSATKPLDFFLDLQPAVEDFREAVIDGLSREPKSLSPKFFYDAAGAALFEKITETPEYYVTRKEKALLKSSANDIADLAGPNCLVLEPGSGGSDKVRLILDALDRPAGYVAIDISRDHLLDQATRMAGFYPDIAVGAICADFIEGMKIPDSAIDIGRRRLGFFPGSTIGNFAPEQAIDILKRFRAILGHDGALLVGIDLLKDVARIESAYNDSQGVTAEFNLNLLHRIVRELDARIDVDGFEHWAFFNEADARMEMHLRSKRDQSIVIGNRRFGFHAGETIHTENCHKFTIEGFEELARRAGFRLAESWADDGPDVALTYLLPDAQ